MSTAPIFDIDPKAFWRDPYPALARMRSEAPIAYVPQLDATLFTRRADIVICEKRIDVFSSHQPDGLMTRLMGRNLMRKDGAAHQAERKAIFPTVSPRTVRDQWLAAFQAGAGAVLDRAAPRGAADMARDIALPISAEALKAITGLTQVTPAEMDSWSQAMIDGIANYAGDPAVEARCHEATACIDAAIDARLGPLRAAPDKSLLGAQIAAGLPEEAIRANVKLAISGGQNEPRDAIAGAVWALLTHPEQLAMALAGNVSWMQVFEEYVRWMSPIGMSPRRVAQPHDYEGVRLDPGDRAFFMFGSANRDEAAFEDPARFDATRDASRHIAFGAGPHFCAGAWASKALVAEVALPAIFDRLPGLRLREGAAPELGGWAFRGMLSLPVVWDPA